MQHALRLGGEAFDPGQVLDLAEQAGLDAPRHDPIRDRAVVIAGSALA